VPLAERLEPDAGTLEDDRAQRFHHRRQR
jgi:hypothetical protein